MTKDEALKLALEALVTKGEHHPRVYQAIAALEEVLAQPAQKIPYPVTGWKVEVRGSNQQLFITGVYGDTIFVDLPVQPVQEPVGMVKELFTQTAWEKLDLRGNTKVYITPPQRAWVGLTDKEINDHWLSLDYDIEDFPDPWDFKQGFRAAERAYGIKDKT